MTKIQVTAARIITRLKSVLCDELGLESLVDRRKVHTV